MSISEKNKKQQYTSYSALISDHIDKLYSIAFRFTKNKVDAEDLVQDLVLKLQPKFESLQVIENPKVWMTKVLYHLFIDNCRRNTRSPISLVTNLDSELSNIEYLDQFPSKESGPVESAESEELISRLDEALKQLSEQDRLMIILFEIEGYSIYELHLVVGMPVGSVKSRLSRARHRLRDLLKDATEMNFKTCVEIEDKYELS